MIGLFRTYSERKRVDNTKVISQYKEKEVYFCRSYSILLPSPIRQQHSPTRQY